MIAESLRIAVADDEADMRDFFERMLPRCGHRVVSVAENGEQLVVHCREQKPDLVITDIKMPGIDGIEASRRICLERPTSSGVTLPIATPDQNPSTFQYQGAPIQRVTMIGKAMRVAYEPTIPKLLLLAGNQVVEEHVKIKGPKVVACFFDNPVYMASWRITYRILGTGYASAQPTPPNPAICCQSESTPPGSSGG